MVAAVVLAPSANAQAPGASFTWNVPDRLVESDNGGLRLPQVIEGPLDDDATYTAGGALPGSFPVSFNPCSSRSGATPIEHFEWRFDGDRRIQPARSPCQRFEYEFPSEGVHTVTLTAVDEDGREGLTVTQEVPVQDWLIVSLGDSVASGEGNPDVESSDPAKAVWRDASCHRSGRAGPARAALKIEELDPKTSVTFVHFACSGATVTRGLLGSQDKRRPQIDRFLDLARQREVDAVLLSVGANDIGFSTVVKRCLRRFGCQNRSSQLEEITRDLTALPNGYSALADHLHGPTALPPERVFMSDYFNPTRDDFGQTCGPHPVDASGWLISEAEWKWAEESVLAPLNEAVYRAAGTHGWTRVMGFDGRDMRNGFYNHGFCATSHWVTQGVEAVKRQGDPFGMVHPNARGHAFYGQRLARALRDNLYHRGNLRRPREPAALVEATSGESPSDHRLAIRFRPRLLFDTSERWRPLDADRFLAEGSHRLCVLRSGSGASNLLGEIAEAFLPFGDRCPKVPDAEHLLSLPGSGPKSALAVNGLRSAFVKRYRANNLTCNDSLEESLRDKLQDCDSGPTSAIYYRVVRWGFMAYVDYWWLLRYNDTDGATLFDHQSDWEGAVVAVDLRHPYTFAWAAHAAHEGEPWRYPRQLLRCDGGLNGSCGSDLEPAGRRVSVFVAEGSHAAYGLLCSRRFFDCDQNESVPERGFDGARGWGGNDDFAALLPLPSDSWTTWEGRWNAVRFSNELVPSVLRGSTVRSPGKQARFKQPWRHRSTACTRAWCDDPLELARLHEVSCRGQPTEALVVRVCLTSASAAPTPGGAPVVSPRETVRIRRFSRGRTEPFASAAGPAEGSTNVELGVGPLVVGERIEVSGSLPAGATVFVRALGDGKEHEAAFVLPAAVPRDGTVRISTGGDGIPELRIGRPGQRDAKPTPAARARLL